MSRLFKNSRSRRVLEGPQFPLSPWKFTPGALALQVQCLMADVTRPRDIRLNRGPAQMEFQLPEEETFSQVYPKCYLC